VDKHSLSEATIRAGATEQSFQRGKALYRDEALSHTIQQGSTLRGRCQGNMRPYYKVKATLDDAGVRDAECECEYDYGGFCKHIVALLLAYVHEPALFESLPDTDATIESLNRDEMAALLKKLAHKHEDVQHELVRLTRSKTKPAASAGRKNKLVDVQTYRKQIQRIIRDASDDYDPYSELPNKAVEEALGDLRQTAVAFLDANDPENALRILDAVFDEIDKGAKYHDYEIIELDDFRADLDLPLAEAVLSQTLDATQKRAWLRRLENREWSFGASLAALNEGWKAKPGKRQVPFARYSDADTFDDADVFEERIVYQSAQDVGDAKLNVLERRGDAEAFLATAKADGKHLRYAQKLVTLNRIDEAVKHALSKFKHAHEALELARQLREAGAAQQAIAVASKGLLWAMPRQSWVHG
jgi:uncharacterized Zn finger protein